MQYEERDPIGTISIFNLGQMLCVYFNVSIIINILVYRPQIFD